MRFLTQDDIRAIATNLGGARKCGNGYACRCPAHNGGDSNLSVSLTKDGKLLLHCFSHGCTFKDILKAIQDRGFLRSHLLGGSDKILLKTQKIPLTGHSTVKEIWSGCLPSEGTVVEQYLSLRGYSDSIPWSLRYHPSLYHKETRAHYRGMVAAITKWPNNDIIGIHRTYLKHDGRDKATIKHNKKMLGSASGGGVRLSNPGRTLVLAEGIETALSLFLAMGVPTWATLSTSGMINVIVPPVEMTPKIIIAADADEPGMAAANKLALRLLAEGYNVSIAMPPEGKDFNDMLGE
jgi:hypothetical protein